MGILATISLGILALLVILVIVAFFLPRKFSIQRDISIARPKPEVFGYVSHLKNQNSYSKWAMADPNMKTDFRGTDGQPGFVSAWEGNKDVGKGEQEIKAIKASERMDTEIRFEKPFKNVAATFLSTEAIGDRQTRVVWSFSGATPWPFNLMSAMMKGRMEKDLLVGLANLKNNLESDVRSNDTAR